MSVYPTEPKPSLGGQTKKNQPRRRLKIAEIIMGRVEVPYVVPGDVGLCGIVERHVSDNIKKMSEFQQRHQLPPLTIPPRLNFQAKSVLSV